MRTLRVIIEDTGTGRTEERDFSNSPVRIGRTRLNDLPLDSAYVSHYHAIITFDDDAIEYLDLGSTNGSFLKGNAIKPFAPINVDYNSPLCIGPLRLTFTYANESASVANQKFIGDTDVNQYQGTEVNPGAIQELRQAQMKIDALRSSYNAYRAAWKKLKDDLHSNLSQIPPLVRSLVFPYIPKVFPQITQESEYRSMIADFGASVKTISLTSVSSILELLGLSTENANANYDEDQLLKQISSMLTAFSNCFVELRRGLDQFSNELAIKAFSRQTGLHAAHTGQDVLAYLIDKDEKRNRVEELTSAFADIMIHQVALLTGVTEGVRSLLKNLDPDTIAKDLENNPEKILGIPISRGFWPLSITALWRRFQQFHANLVEDDHGVSQVLFGREFAKSYDAAKMRHQGGSEEHHSNSRRSKKSFSDRIKSRNRR